jgi:hypothetical protein
MPKHGVEMRPQWRSDGGAVGHPQERLPKAKKDGRLKARRPMLKLRSGSGVEIKHKLVRMRAQAHGVTFAAAFIAKPSLYYVAGEHIALK